MSFTVLIPARLESTRLPRKALVEIGGLPMIVRVAQQAARSSATQVVVATDSEKIMACCQSAGIQIALTRRDHPSGTDRLAEAADQLKLPPDAIVVNVQGDEPLIAPELIDAVADLLATRPQASMATAAHAITGVDELSDPNVVKLITDRDGMALMFSRAPIPWWRDGFEAGIPQLPKAPQPLRHIGIYAYRLAYLRAYPSLESPALEQCEALEQLRALWHGDKIAVHVSARAPAAGVDTAADLERVRKIWAAQHPA